MSNGIKEDLNNKTLNIDEHVMREFKKGTIKIEEILPKDSKANLKNITIYKEIKQILYPENPNFLRRALSPYFIMGILMGFSLSWYYYSQHTFRILNEREESLNKEIWSLKKEIKDIRRKL